MAMGGVLFGGSMGGEGGVVEVISVRVSVVMSIDVSSSSLATPISGEEVCSVSRLGARRLIARKVWRDSR